MGRGPARPPWLLPAAALSLLLLALFWKVFLRGEVFYERDIHLIFLGQTEAFVRAVLGGSWPVWDPYPGFGQPMLANPDAQVLYPFMWLNLLMSPATYYVLFVLAHLFFSAWGMRALARHLGLSESGSLVAAVLWMLCGPFLSLVNVWHHFASASWIPWVLLAADRAVATGRGRGAVLWGVAMAAQVLGGSADMSIMTTLLAVALAARHAVPGRQRAAAAPAGRSLAVAAAAGALALALSAGLWMPTLEAARRSQRWGLPWESRTPWSVHPAALAQVLLPVPLHQLPLSERWSAALFDSREPFLASLYLGAAASALAAAALVGARRSGRGILAGTAVLATLTALGKHSVFYALVTAVMVPLRIIRYPSKAMVFTGFAWALLAAMGYESLRAAGEAGGDRARRVVALSAAAIAALASSAAATAWLAGPSVARWLFDPGISAADASASLAAPAVRLCVVGLGCAALSALAWTGRHRARAAGVAIGVLAAGDLLLAHAGLNRTAPRKILTYRPPTLDHIDQRDRSRLYSYDYYGVAGKRERYLPNLPLSERRRVRQEQWPFLYGEVIRGRTELLPPVGAIWGLFGSFDVDLRGLYPTELSRLDLLLRAVEGTPGHLRLLRIGAVSRVVARHTEGLEELVPMASLAGFGTEPLRVYRVPDPLPRAYVVSGARVAKGDDAFVALVDPAFDSRREVILAAGAPRAPDARFAGSARVADLRADRARLEVELSAPGWVVLVDGYDPGWRATVDGAAAEVLRANVAFRAVPVAAGRHVVDLLYRPRSVQAGLAVTAAGLLIAAAAALSSRGGGGR
jgi:membrane protein YfhO